MFDDFDTQVQPEEIRDWYDYELYYGCLDDNDSTYVNLEETRYNLPR
jgi:hypothetical protein